MVETRRSGAAENRRRPLQAVTASRCHWGGTILVRFSTPGPSLHTYSTPQPLPPYAIIAGTILALSLSLSPYNPAGGCQCRASVLSLCQARVTQSIQLVCESSLALLIPRIDTDASHSRMASLPLCHASINASTGACNGRLSIIPIL